MNETFLKIPVASRLKILVKQLKGKLQRDVTTSPAESARCHGVSALGAPYISFWYTYVRQLWISSVRICLDLIDLNVMVLPQAAARAYVLIVRWVILNRIYFILSKRESEWLHCYVSNKESSRSGLLPVKRNMWCSTYRYITYTTFTQICKQSPKKR